MCERFKHLILIILIRLGARSYIIDIDTSPLPHTHTTHHTQTFFWFASNVNRSRRPRSCIWNYLKLLEPEKALSTILHLSLYTLRKNRSDPAKCHTNEENYFILVRNFTKVKQGVHYQIQNGNSFFPIGLRPPSTWKKVSYRITLSVKIQSHWIYRCHFYLQDQGWRGPHTRIYPETT